MAKETTLKKLLSILTPDGTEVDFSEFDGAVEKLKEGLKDKVQAKTLDDVNGALERFKSKIDLTPLQESLWAIEGNVDSKIKSLKEALDGELAKFNEASSKEKNSSFEQISSVVSSIGDLKDQLSGLESVKNREIRDIQSRLDQLPGFTERVETTFQQIQKEIGTYKPDGSKADKKVVEDLIEALEKLRRELTNRINNIPRGGGNANRNIAIGGNGSVLSMYTDINFKAGNNVTITYQNNTTTKYLDVTIAATGGSGSVGGVVRSIQTISTSQTAGNNPGTDYVYLCSQGVNLALPAAAGNTNLYTVKNISNSSVLVSGTIDNDAAGVIMPVKYTSIDVISNNTDWDIT